jgi:hypothetical protein
MYYLVRVKVAQDTGKGIKWSRESYLVEGVSVTDAETTTHKLFDGSNIEFEVTEVKKSEVIKVL